MRGDLAALISHLDPELVGYASDALNTNHCHFEGDRIKTLRVMGSPA